MAKQASLKRIRKNFGSIESPISMPNMLQLQTESYHEFVGYGEAVNDSRLSTVFQTVFPVRDYAGNAELSFEGLEYSPPRYDQDECRRRDLTFALPVKVKLRLKIYEAEVERRAKRKVKEVRDQSVYMGEIPYMTEYGSFIINGTERAIVSQMHRSPGVFFDHDKGKTHSSGKFLFKARVIPYRGSWLDFEFDSKDKVHFRIDLRRKMPTGVLLKALGLSTQDILDRFYQRRTYRFTKTGVQVKFEADKLLGTRAVTAIKLDNKTIVAEGKKFTALAIRRLSEADVKWIDVPLESMIGEVAAEPILIDGGEILIDHNQELTEDSISALHGAGIKQLECLLIDASVRGPWLADTLRLDTVQSREEARVEIYRMMRPGEPPTVETAKALFESLFYDASRYDLSRVGRMKLNSRLGISDADVPLDQGTLRNEDILIALDTLLSLRDGIGEVDDIDHLGNRRLRSVGELLENQIRIGLVRMERAIRERLTSGDLTEMMPSDVVNAKPLIASVKEFFGSSQLSQFMDQTNPLSEVTHKRRLSALGPGGLSRERAGFEVRDVHPTHYGRLCPIETPEGPNIGLINSLATYAKVNDFGFIESPYRKVVDGKVTDIVDYLSAIDESDPIIAQANAVLDEQGRFVADLVQCRQGGEFIMAASDQINYMDVSPSQVVSVCAGLIPFLEHDDANRALMGSNMQRQAVPLLRSEKPLVGTGMEAPLARDSGVSQVARRGGYIERVDGERIVVRVGEDEQVEGEPGVDIYRLFKYRRSNQNTCFNQRPLVKMGDRVVKGDIIADGPSTDMGELALGRNVLVALMPWRGYNFEDAIVISEKLVRDDVYTSIHIEEFECVSRDTKLGSEEITRDIPNVGEDALRHLDDCGIAYVGAEVKQGDILVGKITPKGESQLSPEEKLLRAIFGEKASDVRDTSMRVKPGEEGVVVDVQIFTRRGDEKDERAKAIEETGIEQLYADKEEERRILEGNAVSRLRALVIGQTAATFKGLNRGVTITAADTESMTLRDLSGVSVDDAAVNEKVAEILESMDKERSRLESRFEQKVAKVREGSELKPGVIKVVKVFVAVKRKLQPGDKMAGRHGNKGVISIIVPEEDMPYTADGTPVEICLNPLGVPSRMNIGQIFEIHMGWAGSELGKRIDEKMRAKVGNDEMRAFLLDVYAEDKTACRQISEMNDAELVELTTNLKGGVPIATPVFDGANEADIQRMLKLAGLPENGQTTLFDGRTGEAFDRPVTIGQMYILKLHHLVDEKIHARSTGPYSLVTQQPLGGKAQFGGQRFGEMEVWALEAYGAAHTLQEMLTVKSDDVQGRTKMYESIVRGDMSFDAGIPESFNVMTKELNALGIDLAMVKRPTENEGE
ncbi:MAG: DNA-directed RNA polymerase subunit beta [Zetaproteobacteria bacterium CG12_big_fil_rev_8_21_14_0_65_54_13]|nr:MAG: DNA-directed RNA polymerase subunit beta [Zetaproteobacteria bacterium CG23_combo_of_CG06-09_8_20_14_all_54_7]PIW44260.1 MAG: DNA-directed RNA polymerase subunit beta [Zetaproteobacteria bacterium CG12_big_fil_rev_8_21_14_0_65_54_13]PIX53941.1 MAG: DNA-directed RNA polymerase subunit beta [Zetaproteobacteria bacterium CG_4_10_14_3_um_filter_54_28]PJA30615.1 MAG: DNA-directed RNA polymerase subunit beta [Zetaproteobacteria bacterium CG_4_9_14_3_um_filter_54_145]